MLIEYLLGAPVGLSFIIVLIIALILTVKYAMEDFIPKK